MYYEFKMQDAYDFAHHVKIETRERNGELTFKKCPYCQSPKDRDTFSINLSTGQFKCLRASCGAQGNMLTLSKDFDFSLGTDVDEYYRPKKQFRTLPQIVPESKTEAVKYMESRGIPQEITERYCLTVQKDKPNVLVFPFYDDKGRLQFIKYRKTDFDKEKDKNKEWSEKNCKPILFGMWQCKNFESLIITEGQCFNGDAEIMTHNGWIRIENYAGQEVLQVNEDLSANFVKPKRYIVKRHIGKMVDVGIDGNYFTSTTDDHNLVFQKANGQLIKRPAIEKISTAYRIPTAIDFESNGLNWSNEMIALYLAVSADGTLDFRVGSGYNNKYPKGMIYARFGITKERKVKRLRGILEKLGIDYSDHILINERGKEYHSICFTCPDCIDSKYLPWSFVTQTTLEQKKFIIDEMVYWDGNFVNGRNQYEYVSIIKNNADVIQAVASTCGYMSTIMQKETGGNGKFKKSYSFKVSILLGKRYVTTQEFEKHKTVYDVDKVVYCVTVDSGMILVRQKNKISVSGNCDSLSVAAAGIENVVSVPTGAKGFTWVPYCWDWVNRFREIVVFGDHEDGKITLLEEISTRFKCKIRHVREQDYRDCKDANEILQKYGKDYLRKCVENAVLLPIKQVIDLADVQNIDPFAIPKLPTGISEVDRLLYGGLPPGVTIIAGSTGEGKSTVASQILVNALYKELNCFAYSGELPNYMFKMWLDYQIAGPKKMFEYSANKWGDRYYTLSETNRKLIAEWYRGRCFLYDNSFTSAPSETKDLTKLTEDVIMQYGVKVVLLDNLMTAMSLDSIKGSDKYERQSAFVNRLAKIAAKHNAWILLVAHKRKDSYSSEVNDSVSGSADITNLASIVLSYERNKDIDPSQRLLKVSKNRVYGKINTKGYILDYDERSKRIYGYGDDVNVDFGWDKSSSEEETPFD